MKNFLSRNNLEYFSRNFSKRIKETSDLNDFTNYSQNRYSRLSDIGGYVPEASNAFYVNCVTGIDDNLDPLQGYSASKAFKTLGYCINRISTQILLGPIVVKMAPGVYSGEHNIIGIPYLSIEGDPSNRELVIIEDNGGLLINQESGGFLQIQDCVLRCTGKTNDTRLVQSVYNGFIIVLNCVFEISGVCQYALMSQCGSVIIFRRSSVRGNGEFISAFCSSNRSGDLQFDNSCTHTTNVCTIMNSMKATLWYQITNQGRGYLQVPFVVNGTLTGKKYDVSNGSQLGPVGNCPNTTIAGTTAMGGTVF